MAALDTTLILSLILNLIFHWKDANYTNEIRSLAYRVNKISPKSPTKNSLRKKNNFLPNETQESMKIDHYADEESNMKS